MVIHLWNIIIKFRPKSLNDQREDDDSLATRHIKLTLDRFTTTDYTRPRELPKECVYHLNGNRPLSPSENF